MPTYNIERLTREEIFGGRLIAPMRQWLKRQRQETKGYNQNADMAIITHYLQNKDIPAGQQLEAEALRLMTKYYRATHTELAPDAPVDQEAAENLFAAIFEAPVYQHFRNNHAFTFVDLFAGIGGFRIALEQLGGRCVYASEFDSSAQKSYGMNHGVMPFGDIKLQENKDRIPENIDVLCAGFPCQPFSIAGVSKKQSLGRATGFEDKTQGTLFFDICRILKAKRPKAFMLENVKNLCSHDKGRTFKVITESLDELDYDVFYQVLDGQNYVPQHRERILIVGFDRRRYGDKVDFEFKLTPVEPKPIMRNILETDVDDKYTLSDKLWNYLQNYAEKHKAAGNGFGYGIADPEGVARTLSARYFKDGSEILIEQPGKNPRRLTPRECARLQGFPESFKIPVSDTQAYKQFGNSVVVPLMSNVAQLVCAKLKELDKKASKGKKNKSEKPMDEAV